MRASTVITAVLLLALAACGGGGGDGGASGVSDPPPGSPPDAPPNVTGQFLLRMPRAEGACGLGDNTHAYFVTLLQTGTSIIGELRKRNSQGGQSLVATFPGSLGGSGVSLAGTYEYGPILVPAWLSIAWQFTLTGDVVAGTETWSYSSSPTGTPVLCSGTSPISGARTLELLSVDYTSYPWTFTFSAPIDPATIGGMRPRRPAPGGSLSGTLQASGNVVTFTPDPGAASPGSQYMATLYGYPDDVDGPHSVQGGVLASTANILIDAP